MLPSSRERFSHGPARWSVLVHGGAGNGDERFARQQAPGCRLAVQTAADMLAAGHGALAAVQAAVVVMEDDEAFNAGTGGALTSAGTLELDAAIMEGAALRAGAVCGLPPHRNPITVARAAMEDGRHLLYGGAGAETLAATHGIAAVPPDSMITDAARHALARALKSTGPALWAGDTVGAVARDRDGNLAAATSTGGMLAKTPGRIGDSPLLGAGTYADNQLGAASATGEGEGIMRVVLAFDALRRMADGLSPDAAAQTAIGSMHRRVGAVGGLIIAAADGRMGLYRNTPHMSWAACADNLQTTQGR